ncbi:GATA transcription factor 27 [Cajanus cajan]|nr:GATA transcription factor 27 [Cajanus cajan]
MEKRHGPCFHCGINYTPLWRNGPEDKPVLCNACGSRYRKWGTLEAYLPNNFQPKYLDNLKYLKDGKNPLVSSYVTITGDNEQPLWSPKIPSRKRSQKVYKNITPMKKFRNQLLKIWKNYRNPEESSPEEVLLLNNVNNFIPSNEIGLGCALHKPDDTSA